MKEAAFPFPSSFCWGVNRRTPWCQQGRPIWKQPSLDFLFSSLRVIEGQGDSMDPGMGIPFFSMTIALLRQMLLCAQCHLQNILEGQLDLPGECLSERSR